jgi:serine/threonine protein kinase
MSKKYKVIGEGTYGCVIKPSLRCTTKENYNNKLSKIMKISDATEELKEYENLKNIDNIEKYAIIAPKLCYPKLTQVFRKTAKKCKNEKIKFRVNNDLYEAPSIKTLAMLLLEDGGVDFHEIHKQFKNFNNNERNNIFYSFLNLFEGILFFRQNNIIHRDIKLGNIVFNINDNKAKFIDFGLSIIKKDFKSKLKNNNDHLSVTWEYFPPESSCGNKIIYNKEDKCEDYRKKITHSKFVDKFILSYDSYCLTFALKSFFKSIKLFFNEYNNLCDEIIKLLSLYCDRNLFTRNTNINYLIKKYKFILDKYNIKKNNTNISPDKVSSLKTINSITNRYSKIKKDLCEKQNKDYNPYTKRCNKKCPANKTRNAKFKCIKIK